MILREVGKYLIDGGIFTDSNLFEGDMGTLDALKGALRMYGGADGEHDLGQGAIRIEQPRIQLEVNGPDYTITLEKMRAAKAYLVAVVNQELSSTRYLSIDPVGDITQLARGGNQEWRFTQSFAVMKAPSTS